MGWLSLVGEGLSLYEQNKASGSANDAQQHGSQQAIDEQRREFDLLQQNLAPYLHAGTGGLAGLDKIANGDYSGFANSPDFQYAREQMINADDHSAAAHFRLGSGGYPVDLAHDINGLASQNLGGYRNSLQYLATLGQNSAAMQGQAGMSMANQIGAQYGNMADARSQMYGQQGNNWANAINQFASSYGQNNAQNNYSNNSSNNSSGNDPFGQGSGFSWDTYGGWG